MTALRLVIRGRVQGVGFRFSLVDAAAGIGVTGWVRNRRDGTVEAFVQGDSIAVDAALAWCQRGPPSARVEGVDAFPSAADPAIAGFAYRPTA